MVYKSNIDYKSTYEFKSSEDINYYLANHPDFQRLPPSKIKVIVAAIVSSILLVGAVAVTCVTGDSTSLVGAIATMKTMMFSAVKGACIGGALNLLIGMKGHINGNFDWDEWGKEFGLDVLTSLILFPTI